MTTELERLKTLAGIETVTEALDSTVTTIKFTHPPATILDIKDGKAVDDIIETTKELTGADLEEHEKITVPKSVKAGIEKRIKELNDSMEKFGGGGPAETTIEQLERFKELLSTGTIADYKAAQLLYGTLWTAISDLLPTTLVNFLHTGKDLEAQKVQ